MHLVLDSIHSLDIPYYIVTVLEFVAKLMCLMLAYFSHISC